MIVDTDFGSKEWMEQIQKLWNPIGFPFSGIGQPTLDPKEIEQKINELKVVQNWLQMNVSMIDMTTKTLEMQKAAIEALSASVNPEKSGSSSKGQKKK
jgi:hypothetical protein